MAMRGNDKHDSGGTAMSQQFWDEKRETLLAAERSTVSLKRLQSQLQDCYARIPFYRRHWDRAGFHPDQVRTWEDFSRRCPVIDKKMLVADQSAYPPFGSYLGINRVDICRVHASSGTKGTPTFYGVGGADWARAKEIFALTQWAMGVRPDDVVQIAFPFSLFFGGWGVLYGAEAVGATCFPIGASDTKRHVELLFRLESTVLEATPSYVLHMAEVARELGFDPRRSKIKHLIVGGEAGGSIPSTRQRMLDAWDAQSVCDSGSTSEMFPFCTNSECTEMTGPHLFNDEVWTEIVDSDDPGRLLPEGERGALVYTHLWRTSQPMIRFASGDAATMSYDPCACGRTYPRLPHGVLGRVDDMLVVRGVNVYPSTIEHALRTIGTLGLEYRVFIDRYGELDEVTVHVELREPIEDPESERVLNTQVQEALRYHCQVRLGVVLEPPQTFERTTMKAQRLVDRRIQNA